MKNDGKDIDNLRWRQLQKRVTETNLVKAFNRFRSHKIEPILIKGWAIARYYPENHYREFVDIDLSVNPAQYDKARNVYKTTEINRINIDLHKGLRHLDTVLWEDLFENSRLVKIDETEIRVLRPEDHLRVLCVHWLTNGGEEKERLWDICYAVKNRPADFDWDRCLNRVSEKRRRWITAVILLAHKYSGLDIENIPFRENEKQLPDWLIETIETEWKFRIPLVPLQSCISDRQQLFKQIKKRFPPNPITATVNMEGDFDEKPRIVYQIPDIFVRLAPSIVKFSKIIFHRISARVKTGKKYE